jgi:formylglycine-generating enzyme required for sulfatase activity
LFLLDGNLEEPNGLILRSSLLAVEWELTSLIFWGGGMRFISQLVIAVIIFSSQLARAVNISTVPVDNPGNAADDTGFGSVAYSYQIGKYEVTNAQYVEFLNGVDPTGANALALYNSSMTSNANGGITFTSGAASGSKYRTKSGRDDNPVAYVSWYDALRFANWLHNGTGSGDTENGAYTLVGGTPTPTNANSITRSAGAKWWLPSEDEWYKAAYHKNDGATGNYWDYPTSTDAEPFSDQPPGSGAPTQSNAANFYRNDGAANGYNDGYAVTGSTSFSSAQNYLTNVGAYTVSASPYGTFDQGGNVWEWTEAILGSSRGVRGASWSSVSGATSMIASARAATNPTGEEFIALGFRVASQPPPLTGDYNFDNIVDARDYVVWRKNVGTVVALGTNGDANGNGFVENSEYQPWRSHFGQSISGSAASVESASVPEPTTLAILVIGLVGYCMSASRRW